MYELSNFIGNRVSWFKLAYRYLAMLKFNPDTFSHVNLLTLLGVRTLFLFYYFFTAICCPTRQRSGLKKVIEAWNSKNWKGRWWRILRLKINFSTSHWLCLVEFSGEWLFMWTSSQSTAWNWSCFGREVEKKANWNLWTAARDIQGKLLV